jgi:hypothetical protein
MPSSVGGREESIREGSCSASVARFSASYSSFSFFYSDALFSASYCSFSASYLPKLELPELPEKLE